MEDRVKITSVSLIDYHMSTRWVYTPIDDTISRHKLFNRSKSRFSKYMNDLGEVEIREKSVLGNKDIEVKYYFNYNKSAYSTTKVVLTKRVVNKTCLDLFIKGLEAHIPSAREMKFRMAIYKSIHLVKELGTKQIELLETMEIS